ncbi:MAG: hypothetical protein Q4E61_04265, partial [Alphaproteobacteria bacterium]|nr:hypothetical protein [Alphaproteobacteria bacterium]
KQHNIPLDITSDIMNGRKKPAVFSDFIIFCFIETVADKKIKEFYVEKEIKKYSKEKYSAKKIEFPIVIPAIQVADDQWISAPTTNFLMELRDVNMINYNENTQRTMTKEVNGSKEIWSITLNKTAVSSIKNAFETKTYIPTEPITLNIPEDSEYFYENGNLIIENIEEFDIIDGYHRYVAMSQIKDVDPGFVYPITLQFVAYPESKAKHFIYQADQKTHMSKIDSNSYNQQNAGNIIAKRINEDFDCNVAGMITPTSNLISSIRFGDAISKIFFGSSQKKHNDRKKIVQVKNSLIKTLNYLTDEYPEEYLSKSYSSRKLHCICYFTKDNVALKDMNKMIKSVCEYCKENRVVVSNETIKKALKKAGGLNVQ